MSQLSFEGILAASWSMLERFYENPIQIDLLDYVRLGSGNRSQVLLEENIDEDTLFIAAEFPMTLKQKVESSSAIELQSLSVVSEELSHLYHLIHAAQSETQLSV